MPERNGILMESTNNDRLNVLQKRLNAYYKAEEKILRSKSFSIGTKQLTRTSLAQVQAKIKELEEEIAIIKDRGTVKRRSVRVVPFE